MKAMKAKTSMKTRPMKKAVSKIARGKLAKVVVCKGNKEKTASGHKKADLMLNERNKIVTKKQNAAGKKAYKNISAWTCLDQRSDTGEEGARHQKFLFGERKDGTGQGRAEAAT